MHGVHYYECSKVASLWFKNDIPAVVVHSDSSDERVIAEYGNYKETIMSSLSSINLSIGSIYVGNSDSSE